MLKLTRVLHLRRKRRCARCKKRQGQSARVGYHSSEHGGEAVEPRRQPAADTRPSTRRCPAPLPPMIPNRRHSLRHSIPDPSLHRPNTGQAIHRVNTYFTRNESSSSLQIAALFFVKITHWANGADRERLQTSMAILRPQEDQAGQSNESPRSKCRQRARRPLEIRVRLVAPIEMNCAFHTHNGNHKRKTGHYKPRPKALRGFGDRCSVQIKSKIGALYK